MPHLWKIINSWDHHTPKLAYRKFLRTEGVSLLGTEESLGVNQVLEFQKHPSPTPSQMYPESSLPCQFAFCMVQKEPKPVSCEFFSRK